MDIVARLTGVASGCPPAPRTVRRTPAHTAAGVWCRGRLLTLAPNAETLGEPDFDARLFEMGFLTLPLSGGRHGASFWEAVRIHGRRLGMSPDNILAVARGSSSGTSGSVGWAAESWVTWLAR